MENLSRRKAQPRRTPPGIPLVTRQDFSAADEPSPVLREVSANRLAPRQPPAQLKAEASARKVGVLVSPTGRVTPKAGQGASVTTPLSDNGMFGQWAALIPRQVKHTEGARANAGP